MPPVVLLAGGVGLLNSVAISISALTSETTDSSQIKVALLVTIGGIITTGLTSIALVLVAKINRGKEQARKPAILEELDEKDAIIKVQRDLIESLMVERNKLTAERKAPSPRRRAQ